MFIGLEVKKPKKNQTLIQQVELDAIKKSGGYAQVVRSLKDAQQIVASAQRTEAVLSRCSIEQRTSVQQLPSCSRSKRATLTIV